MTGKKLGLTMIFITVIFFAALFLISVFYISKTFVNSSQTIGVDTNVLYDGHSFESDLYSSQDNLYLILIHLKNGQIANKDNFEFNLTDSKGVTVRHVDISGSNIGNDDWVRFQFLPIPNSKDKNYRVNLSSTTLESQPKIEVVTNNGHMAYKSYSKLPYFKTLAISATIFIATFFIDMPFAIFYAIILALPIVWYLKETYY